VKYKIGETILYPLNSGEVKTGTIVGKGRYENLYVIETDKGTLLELRLDQKYEDWLSKQRTNKPIKSKIKRCKCGRPIP
jgi:hypothetical protein